MRSAVSDTAGTTRAEKAKHATSATRRNIQNARKDGSKPEMPYDPEQDGEPTEFDLDNMWYEAFADKVHAFGKSWPNPLSAQEYDEYERYADSKVRRPKDA
jgi:hypothetical protein